MIFEAKRTDRRKIVILIMAREFVINGLRTIAAMIALGALIGAVKGALVQGGISASRIHVISFGKERPFCTESNEACWQQNRRGLFVYQK